MSLFLLDSTNYLSSQIWFTPNTELFHIDLFDKDESLKETFQHVVGRQRLTGDNKHSFCASWDLLKVHSSFKKLSHAVYFPQNKKLCKMNFRIVWNL